MEAKPTAQPRDRTGASLELPEPTGPTTVETVWDRIHAEQDDTPKPPPVTEPGPARRTRIWCGQCGCQLWYTPGGRGCAYECRVCGWCGDAY